MDNHSENLKALNEKLELLLKKQELFSREIWDIKEQLQNLNVKASKAIQQPIEQPRKPENEIIIKKVDSVEQVTELPEYILEEAVIPPLTSTSTSYSSSTSTSTPTPRFTKKRSQISKNLLVKTLSIKLESSSRLLVLPLAQNTPLKMIL